MKFKNACAALALSAASVVLTHSAAIAGQQDFTISNKTGYAIKHVYVSEANNDSWEEDVLGRDVLDNGDSWDLKFAKGEKTCKWDLKAVYDDGESAVWHEINLCEVSKVTLRWNKNSGTTTATFD